MDTKKILVVDDDEDLRSAVTAALRFLKPNIVVAEAGNGQEAIELIAKETPDIVISDIKMPLIDGITLLKLLREEGYRMTFGFLSGENGDARTEAERLGDFFIPKPFEFVFFEECMSRFFSCDV